MEECRCDPAIGRVLRLMTKKEEREARKLEKLRLEKERMYEMFSFEREYGDHQAICGIDEVEEDHLQDLLLRLQRFCQKTVIFYI